MGGWMDGQMGGYMGGWVGKMDRWSGRHIHHMVRFEVLTATTMKMAVFWDVASYCLVDIDQCLYNHPDDEGSKIL
jgi:hypothetical protein